MDKIKVHGFTHQNHYALSNFNKNNCLRTDCHNMRMLLSSIFANFQTSILSFI